MLLCAHHTATLLHVLREQGEERSRSTCTRYVAHEAGRRLAMFEHGFGDPAAVSGTQHITTFPRERFAAHRVMD